MKKTISSAVINFFVFFVSIKKVFADIAPGAYEQGVYVSAGTVSSKKGLLITSFPILLPSVWILTAVLMILWLLMREGSSARKIFGGLFLFFLVISIGAVFVDLFVLQ